MGAIVCRRRRPIFRLNSKTVEIVLSIVTNSTGRMKGVRHRLERLSFSAPLTHIMNMYRWGDSVVLFEQVCGVGRLIFVDVVTREESALDKLDAEMQKI